MAHTKAKGSTKLGRDSESKRLGVKRYAGETVKPGEIIIRQRGTKFMAGTNVRKGDDDTLYASKLGVVKFTNKKKVKYDGSWKIRKMVNVVPAN